MAKIYKYAVRVFTPFVENLTNRYHINIIILFKKVVETYSKYCKITKISEYKKTPQRAVVMQQEKSEKFNKTSPI